jgi:hypothetical protein
MAPIQYIVVIAALPYLAFANQPDVLFPHYAVPFECLQQPDGGGCRAWAANDIHLFATGQATGQLPPGAANLCAIPGAATGSATGGPETASAGPFCYCANTGKAHWCLPMLDIPEQINLMYASPDVIVAGFVTYERAAPTTMAVATLREEGGDSPTATTQNLTGVSHWVSFTPTASATQQQRNYTMHFVKFAGLKPSRNYTYAVKSGAATGVWSASFTFRSPRAAPETAFAMYGDLSVRNVKILIWWVISVL